MKKTLLAVVVALFGIQMAQAQKTEFGVFNHVGIGASIGTDGIGFEVSAPLTEYASVRLGYSFMPSYKYTGNFDFDSDEGFLRKEDGSGYYDNVDVEAKLNMGDVKVLFDIYPFRNASFRLTTGAYFGKDKFVTAKSTNHFINKGYWGTSGPELGNASNTYTIVSDENGAINADLKVSSFKPYLGIGFGRAVPSNRVSVSFDLGVQFWGKPGLWTNIDDNVGTEYRKIEKDRILSKQDWCEDFKDGLDIMEKVIIYPVLSLRINGRIF